MKTQSWIVKTLIILLMAVPLLASPEDEDPLALSPEMIVFLDENVTPHASPLHQLRDLLDLVFNDGDLGFQYSTTTHTAAEAFERRHGSCLSFTNMFIAMARHLGLEVRFREADAVPVWEQRGEVFTVSQHMNAAVDIGSRQLVVDLDPKLREREIGGTVVSDERGLAHFQNNRAMERLVAGDFEGASGYLDRALELAPEAPFLWTNLGVLRSREKDLEGAKQAYLRALELRPDYLPALINMVTVHTRLHEPKLADRYRQEARGFRERNPYYHYNLGLRAWTSGDLQEALEHYKKAVKMKREEHRFHFGLAQVFTRLGKTDRALHHLEKASLYAPDESGRLRYQQEQRQLLAQH